MSFGELLYVQPNCRFRGRTTLKFAYQPNGKRAQGILCRLIGLFVLCCLRKVSYSKPHKLSE